MPWPVNHLTPTHIALINDMIESRELEFKAEISTDFPDQCCYDTCAMIFGDVKLITGTKGYRWNIIHGIWCDEEGYPDEQHVWIMNAAKEIVDPTIRQFVPDESMIVRPGDGMHSRYWRGRY